MVQHCISAHTSGVRHAAEHKCDDAALQCDGFRAGVGICSSPRMQVSSFVQHPSLQLAGILAVAFTDIAHCHPKGQDHASARL